MEDFDFCGKLDWLFIICIIDVTLGIVVNIKLLRVTESFLGYDSGVYAFKSKGKAVSEADADENAEIVIDCRAYVFQLFIWIVVGLFTK